MREQAFVVFRNPIHAEVARSALQNFNFMGKPLKIEFAKSVSYSRAIDEGKFVYKEYKKDKKIRKTTTNGVHTQRDWTNILLVENFPAEASEEMLTFLFRSYPGFKSSRLIKERSMGFVEFDEEAQASIALNALNGFKMNDTNILKVSYAKRDQE